MKNIIRSLLVGFLFCVCLVCDAQDQFSIGFKGSLKNNFISIGAGGGVSFLFPFREKVFIKSGLEYNNYFNDEVATSFGDLQDNFYYQNEVYEFWGAAIPISFHRYWEIMRGKNFSNVNFYAGAVMKFMLDDSYVIRNITGDATTIETERSFKRIDPGTILGIGYVQASEGIGVFHIEIEHNYHPFFHLFPSDLNQNITEGTKRFYRPNLALSLTFFPAFERKGKLKQKRKGKTKYDDCPTS